MEDNTSHLKRKANYGQFVKSRHKKVGTNEVKKKDLNGFQMTYPYQHLREVLSLHICHKVLVFQGSKELREQSLFP